MLKFWLTREPSIEFMERNTLYSDLTSLLDWLCNETDCGLHGAITKNLLAMFNGKPVKTKAPKEQALIGIYGPQGPEGPNLIGPQGPQEVFGNGVRVVVGHEEPGPPVIQRIHQNVENMRNNEKKSQIVLLFQKLCVSLQKFFK